MDTLKNLYFRTWRPAIVVLSLVGLAYFLYFHQLGTLVPGYNSLEVASVASASNWHDIAQNPVNAPYKVLVWLFTAVLHHGLIVSRIVSAAFGTAAVLVFFTIVRRLFSFRVAFFGTLLFATSAGFLHLARLGTPQVLEMGVLAFIGSVLWYRQSVQRKAAAGYLVVLLCALMCYISGLIWFELLGFAVLYGGIQRRLRETPALHVTLYSILFLAVLAPLVVAGAHDSQVLLSTAGLPADFHQLSHFGSNLLNGIAAIGIRGPSDPVLRVGHAPLLNSIEVVLLAMGVYYYVRHERSVRTAFMLSGVGIALLLIGLGAQAGYAALVPLLYIFVVSGLNQLLVQWLTVFPRNPFARFIGLGLVCVMLFFSVLYQVRSYFVAWPHNAATDHAFNQRKPD